MKFRTRLRVTFVTIIALPLVLTALAFCGIGLYLMNIQDGFPVEDLDYTAMTENMGEVVDATDGVFLNLKRQIAEDPSRLADREYLEAVNSQIIRKTTYIIVRRENELYYAGNRNAAEAIFSRLPAYGEQGAEDSGFYFDDLDKYVK